MANSDSDTMHSNRIHKMIKDLAPHALQTDGAELTKEEFGIAGLFLQDESLPQWPQRLQAFLLSAHEREQLEELGKHTNTKMFTTFLEIFTQIESEQLWRLNPILVGLPHHVFLYTLLHSTDEELHILQGQCLGEPMQHQLTVLIHDLQKEEEERDEALESLRNRIFELDPDNLQEQKFEELLFALKGIEENNHRLLSITNKGLSLAWNSGRIDLVNELNQLKDHTIKSTTLGIGHPRTQNRPATGLYEVIERHLGQVFGANKETNSLEALSDDEPAIEGLTKWSIWYLKDYWSLGLLPDVFEEKELSLDPSKHSEKEVQDHKEKLMQQVRDHLKRAGLETVGDLKTSFLYSKERLKSFLARRFPSND